MLHNLRVRAIDGAVLLSVAMVTPATTNPVGDGRSGTTHVPNRFKYVISGYCEWACTSFVVSVVSKRYLVSRYRLCCSLPGHLEHLPRGEVLGAVRGEHQRGEHHADEIVVEVVLEEVEGLRRSYPRVKQIWGTTVFIVSSESSYRFEV